MYIDRIRIFTKKSLFSTDFESKLNKDEIFLYITIC